MTPDVPQRWPTTDARQSLALRLHLPYDPSMQDWEWEVADPSRFGEFLDTYSHGGLTEDERFALMEVLIQCVEDMGLPADQPSPQWQSVASLLLASADLHASSVRYWACLDDRNLEDCFGVSGPMRHVWQVIRGSAAGMQDATGDL
jgi:hypothetical protein